MKPVELQDVGVEEITIPPRHRKEMGDLDALARSIETAGILQPIGLDLSLTLLWGERRFRAMRDVLGWLTVPALVLDMDTLGTDPLVMERDENDQRKELTVSERVEIARAIREHAGERRGRPSEDKTTTENIPEKIPELNAGQETRQIAAVQAGFGNERTMRQAEQVVEKGTPEVIRAMDEGTLSISAAADVATLAPTEQARVLTEVASGKKATKALAEAKTRAESPPPDQAESEKTAEQWKDKPVHPSVADRPVDEVGIPIPDKLLEVFESREQFDTLTKTLRTVQKQIGELATCPGGEALDRHLGHKKSRGKDSDPDAIRAYCEHVVNAISKLRWARPYASICPYCHHEQRIDPECNACRGQDWTTESTWKNAPEDYRESTRADALEMAGKDAEEARQEGQG